MSKKTEEIKRSLESCTNDYCQTCSYRNELCDYVTHIDEHYKAHRAKDVRDGNDYCSFGERRGRRR